MLKKRGVASVVQHKQKTWRLTRVLFPATDEKKLLKKPVRRYEMVIMHFITSIRYQGSKTKGFTLELKPRGPKRSESWSFVRQKKHVENPAGYRGEHLLKCMARPTSFKEETQRNHKKRKFSQEDKKPRLDRRSIRRNVSG